MLKSIRKKLYIKNLSNSMHSDWNHLNKKIAGIQDYDIRCTECPKYSPLFKRCKVPFGSKLRSCICASTEFHLQNAAGKKVLEIGCGESEFVRSCVEAVGGEWVGIDPRPGKKNKSSMRSVGAQVAYLPFTKSFFDIVVGTQTIEHWEDPSSFIKDCTYSSAMSEIWRVLKPGGYFYLDAPIHLHGAFEFILGDIHKIKSIFLDHNWENLTLLSWRKKCEPLAPAIPKKQKKKQYSETSNKQIMSLKNQRQYIIAISAYKPNN